MSHHLSSDESGYYLAISTDAPHGKLMDKQTCRAIRGALAVTTVLAMLASFAIPSHRVSPGVQWPETFGLNNLLTIHVDGVPLSYNVVALRSTSSDCFNVSGGSVVELQKCSTPPEQGIRLWTALDRSQSASSYTRFKLLGKSLSYTIDLSGVGCSCNAALYWVSMPGIGQDGLPATGSMGNYYCDANQVGGVWCWELDTIEANMYAMQVAPHTCNNNADQHITFCDKGGATRNTWLVNPKGLCPSDDCIIDSRKPFRHVQNFVSDGSMLVRIENRLHQGQRVFPFNGTSDSNYLAAMSNVLQRGMTLTFQIWGGPELLMSWLDAMSGCSGNCSDGSRVVYSDISLEPL